MRPSARSFSIVATATLWLVPMVVQAQTPPPPPPPPAAPPAPATTYYAPAAPVAQPAPPPPAVVVAPEGGPTDHDLVVGRWGIEAKQVGVFQRSPGNDPACDGGTDCPLRLNAFSLRRWHSPTYAWNAGLVLGIGGGSRSQMGMTRSWDTYFGFGPTVGASFLLTSWKHLAVSASPQLDFVFFMPRGSGSKTFLINARGLVEGELHLGFIGLPELSVGTASGLVVGFRGVTKPTANPGGLATQWDIGFSGPQSLWGLVTNVYLRFYF
jgi:hypothetical protein